MSAVAESESGMMRCASCGIAEIDDIKLKNCTACYLVRYCSVKCQKDHRKHHKRDCKKRAAELRDELLFKQPESSYLGDCPICLIPLPIDKTNSAMMACCSKVICNGCAYANTLRENEAALAPSCPFCRKPLAKTKEESDQQRMKRVELNDPDATCQEGVEQYAKGDYKKSFEYYAKAAELGDADAHCRLAVMYYDGQGVEKDDAKAMYHLEEAAIAGHPEARHGLGCEEWKNGNVERAARHWVIAVKQGKEESIKVLMKAFKRELVVKEDLTAALRAHQAAVDAAKSPQREAAEGCNWNNWNRR